VAFFHSKSFIISNPNSRSIKTICILRKRTQASKKVFLCIISSSESQKAAFYYWKKWKRTQNSSSRKDKNFVEIFDYCRNWLLLTLNWRSSDSFFQRNLSHLWIFSILFLEISSKMTKRRNFETPFTKETFEKKIKVNFSRYFYPRFLQSFCLKVCLEIFSFVFKVRCDVWFRRLFLI